MESEVIELQRAEDESAPGGTHYLAVGILTLGVVVAAIASIVIGAKTLPLGTSFNAVFHYNPHLSDQAIVHQLRIPRTVLALSVGGALGLAGAIMQGVTRNPLADPGLLGVNAGASLAVVTAISVFGVATPGGYVWFAFIGAALAAVFVYTLGSIGGGSGTPVKLAIAGAATAALLSSVTAGVLLVNTAALNQYRFWAVGSVTGRSLHVFWAVAPFLLLGAIGGLGSARSLNGLALGDDVARSLGQRIGLARAGAAASIVLLCGAATAAAGPIGFIGLTVPHIARAITGPDNRWLLPCSILMGAVLLTSADVIGRLVARPGELEVGVVTAFLGAPIFIAFVRRRRMAEL